MPLKISFCASPMELEEPCRASEAKTISREDSLNALRRQVFIPDSIENASIRTELPACYRNLQEALTLLTDLVKEVERFAPVAYIGQL